MTQENEATYVRERVSLAEAAKRLGLSTIRPYKRSHPQFPKPCADVVSRYDLYFWDEIADWYYTNIKPKQDGKPSVGRPRKAQTA